MASVGHRKVGSSRTVNGFNESSSSVDWLGREMLEMRLRDKDKVEHDEERVSYFWKFFLITTVCRQFAMFLRRFAINGEAKYLYLVTELESVSQV